MAKLAVIGAGNMGCAIVDGILAAGILSTGDVVLSRRNAEKLDRYKEIGCTVTPDAVKAAGAAQYIMMAVKPQMTGELFKDIKEQARGKLVISIAAGVTIDTIEKSLPGTGVVRVMPNTPLMVGNGVSALCRGTGVSDEDYSFAKSLFSAAGLAVDCDEELINPLTALTSSSVAYFARMIGVMTRWAVSNGFDKMPLETVIALAAKTCEGSAKLICEKDISPEALVRAVTSPHGTTEKALATFDALDFDGTVEKAMTACLDRANELSRGN